MSWSESGNELVAKAIIARLMKSIPNLPTEVAAGLQAEITAQLERKDKESDDAYAKLETDYQLVIAQANYNGAEWLKAQKLVEAYKAIKNKNWGLNFGAGLSDWKFGFTAGFILLF
jgi:hypothetical protein